MTDGKLTQAQADVMIQNMQTMVKTMVERTTTGPMMGGQGAWLWHARRHGWPRHGETRDARAKQHGRHQLLG